MPHRRVRRRTASAARPVALATAAALALAPLAAPRAAGGQGAPPAAAPRPTLVVFLTVDQMRADYLTTRFGGQLTGGLRRLRDGGVLFTNAHQDHAITETAPGHASTMSGRFPASTGIVRNAAGVQDPQAPLLNGGEGGPASPFRFRGSTLVDWMRSADPRSRALSISRKDRGAILPLGRAKQQVYWWGGAAGWTTSSWYADTLPSWVQRLNAADPAARYAGRAWTPLLPDSAYAEPDGVSEAWGNKQPRFPHVLPDDPTAARRALPGTPFMDEVTLDAALAGLRALDLGRGPVPDVLAVSLSSTDAVGHAWGMESRELHDQVLRLDRALDGFLDSLFALRDSSRVVIALTGDHAMAEVPALHFAKERAAARTAATAATAAKAPTRRPATIAAAAASARAAHDDESDVGYADVARVLRAHNARLAARGVPEAAQWDLESGALVVDEAALRAARVRPDSALDAVLAEVRTVPGVLYATKRSELAALAAGRDSTAAHYARRWLHMLPADAPVVATITLQPFWYWRGTNYATHGSPHDYDSNVPVLFWGAPFARGKRVGEFARVVDMAPTLAEVLGVAPTEALDGKVLKQAFR